MTSTMRASFHHLALVLVGLAGSALIAANSTEPPPRPSSEVIVFGGDWKYPPFHFLDSNGQPDGFDVDLFRSVASEAGLATDFDFADWDQVVDGLSAGRIDVVPMFVTPERQQRYHFTKPFLHRYHLVFGRRGTDPVESLDELTGRLVAVQIAGLAWEKLSEQPGVLVIPVAVEGDALQAVADGKAEFAVVPTLIGYEAQIRLNLPDIVALSPPVFEVPYAFAVTPAREDLVARINHGLQEVSRTGEQDRIYRKWLANLQPPGESYRRGVVLGLWIALPLLLAAVLAVLSWRRARQRATAEEASRREAEAAVRHLASTDPITKLPNRNALLQELRSMIDGGVACAAMRIDLLGIGSVEAIAGQEFVESLLREMARRLSGAQQVRLVGAVGRRGLVLVCGGFSQPSGVDPVIRQVIGVAQSRLELDDVPLEQVCRIGVAMFPEHGERAEDLLRKADLACWKAHEQRIRALIYDASLEPDPRNLTLLAELREAIRLESLGYHVQPKIDLPTGRIVGAELLVRWEHPRHGPLAPSQFVPLAERTGVIGEMTSYLVACTARLCRDWKRRNLDLSLAINVSVNDLSEDALVGEIVTAFEGLGSAVIIEITETDVMQNPDRVLAAVRRIRSTGVRFSLDDFGTGYSSLTYLRQLAPDEVKIDRKFVTDVLSSEADKSIVGSMISLAHSLGAVAAAEGIEDAATLSWLSNAGCDLGQGYFIGRPMSVESFIGLVERSRP